MEGAGLVVCSFVWGRGGCDWWLAVGMCMELVGQWLLAWAGAGAIEGLK